MENALILLVGWLTMLLALLENSWSILKVKCSGYIPFLFLSISILFSSDSVLRHASSDFKKMGQRIFIFIIGGATRSEVVSQLFVNLVMLWSIIVEFYMKPDLLIPYCSSVLFTSLRRSWREKSSLGHLVLMILPSSLQLVAPLFLALLMFFLSTCGYVLDSCLVVSSYLVSLWLPVVISISCTSLFS